MRFAQLDLFIRPQPRGMFPRMQPMAFTPLCGCNQQHPFPFKEEAANSIPPLVEDAANGVSLLHENATNRITSLYEDAANCILSRLKRMQPIVPLLLMRIQPIVSIPFLRKQQIASFSLEAEGYYWLSDAANQDYHREQLMMCNQQSFTFINLLEC
jgi:hypothetical protein